jgi:hypothetical protein
MFFVLAISSLGASLAFAGEETYEGFKITTDNGRITNMAISNPTTDLGIEAEFAFAVSADGTPSGCTITFKNNLQRQMKPGELALHFAECGGTIAVWDYYGQHGKTVSYSLANDKVPADAFGKAARVLLNDGKQYFGKLAKLTGLGEGYSLTVEGAGFGPLQFTNNTIKEIQVMK